MTTTLEQERAARPPMESVREAPFTLVRSDDEPSDGLTLDGFGAVFNRMTVIDSWEGRFRERIAPGAMKRSFRETPPRIQFDHGRHPLIGSIPIASLVRVAEEVHPELAPEGGARIIGRVFDNWLMQPVRDAIAAGAIDGMSFRFSVVRESWQYADGRPIRNDDELAMELERTWREQVPDDDLPIRTLKELKVPEMGPVVWPAYQDTSVGIRSQVIDLSRLDDPETKRLLARAVFIADTVERDGAAQQPAAEPAAGARPDPSPDAQRSTSDVGERPSTPRNRRNDLILRQQRDTLIRIRDREKR